MKNLTKKQQEIFNFIKSFIAENGYPPSHHEIKDQFNYSSQNAVADHLRRIERNGFITIAHKISRGIKIIRDIE